MKTQSQRKFVENELLREGKISRNYCLELYDLKIRTNILRLGAIICELIKSGWDIEGKEVITPTGKDFQYFLRGSPLKKIVYKIEGLDKEITVYK